MLLIAGLGNPGRRYAGNRHNIGFMAADAIHRRHRLAPWRARFEGETSEGSLDGEKVIVLKPATYMNESGRSVGQAMRFYKLTPADLVVIYDELDLPPGKVRLKKGGGSSGHKGIRSIEGHVGKDFRRMRIGIGHPGTRELVNGYVLHDFAKADHEWIEPLLVAIADHAPVLARGDDANFMNRVHLATADGDTEDGTEDDDPAPKKTPPSPRRAGETKDGDKPISNAFAGLKKLFGRDSH